MTKGKEELIKYIGEMFDSSKFDPDKIRKTPVDFLKDSGKNYRSDYLNLTALDFYGRKISNRQFYNNSDKTGVAFANIGLRDDDVIAHFCLNVPETFYSLYGISELGAISEWFNPKVVTVAQLHDYIVNNNIKAIVIIDIMYPIVKEAIKGTNIEHVIVTSVQDSFQLNMNILYGIQVFGLDYLLKNPYYQHVLSSIDGRIASERDLGEMSIDEQRKVLKFYQKIILNIDKYAKAEMIMPKASFYKDEDRDPRFILWKDFIKEYGYGNLPKRKYEEGKESFIIHTGGTSGPAKPIAMTDYAFNAGPYQASITPGLNIDYEDSILQLVPPMVGLSLVNMHIARYFQMLTYMITTYDHRELMPLMLKHNINHFLGVTSFAETIVDNPLVNKTLAKGKDLGFIKSYIFGGEGVASTKDQEIDEALEETGASARTAHGFAMNESFGLFTLNVSLPGVAKKYGSAGMPLVGDDFKILDPKTGKELPQGLDENGEPYIGDLYIHTESGMIGYIRDAAIENDSTIVMIDGKRYFKTKDVGSKDEYGRLCDVSRDDRLIRTQQGKIVTSVLENILGSIPEIKESIVVKSPHPINVAEASCHIVLKDEYQVPGVFEETIQRVVAQIEEKTARMYTYYTPGTYEFRTEIIKTPFGKADFRLLERQNQEEYKQNGGKALQKIRIKKD